MDDDDNAILHTIDTTESLVIEEPCQDLVRLQEINTNDGSLELSTSDDGTLVSMTVTSDPTDISDSEFLTISSINHGDESG